MKMVARILCDQKGFWLHATSSRWTDGRLSQASAILPVSVLSEAVKKASLAPPTLQITEPICIASRDRRRAETLSRSHQELKPAAAARCAVWVPAASLENDCRCCADCVLGRSLSGGLPARRTRMGLLQRRAPTLFFATNLLLRPPKVRTEFSFNLVCLLI